MSASSPSSFRPRRELARPDDVADLVGPARAAGRRCSARRGGGGSRPWALAGERVASGLARSGRGQAGCDAKIENHAQTVLASFMPFGPAVASVAITYERHRSEATTLYQVVQENLETLYGAVDDGAVKVAPPPFGKKELEGYLECGLLCRGFARLRCGGCTATRLVAFSCTCRSAPARPRRDRTAVRSSAARACSHAETKAGAEKYCCAAATDHDD